MVQERPVRVERRLSAVLAADTAGYSRLMHDNEEATHAKLTSILVNVVNPAISEHGGRIVKYTGDGFLAEFPSAIGAVRAATEFQGRTHDLTIDDPKESRICFRVGINIGDVIVEAHDIFGDEVNIAARLEGIAEPGGVCISSSVYSHVHGKVAVEFADLGDRSLKNIARPVRVYALCGKGSGSVAPAHHQSPSVPSRSIVVLPLVNLGGDTEQQYFVDGVTENLTTDLSRIVGLFVIARNTAFTFKDKAVDVRQVGRDLNVRYVLEGSVQRGDHRLRVNVQLVDAENGVHLWAERFDKSVSDLFDMQDEIVSRLANQLQAQLTDEAARQSQRSELPNSMDLYFQGRASWNKGWSPEYMAQARTCFEKALSLDSSNVEAMVGTAGVDVIVGATFYNDTAARLAAAEATILRALSQAPKHAGAHLVLGDVLILTKRVDQGIAECERALTLNHNLAEAHGQIGLAKLFLGRGAETEQHVNMAFRLSPRDTVAFWWLSIVGFAKLQINGDGEAIGWFSRSIETNRNYPTSHFGLAASLALSGALEQAKIAAKAGLALNPQFNIRRYSSSALSDHPTYLAARQRIYRGLRIAGIPED
ncbi:adenylate/guanylate cyclase domain-containing protein [Bradyrhizobium monzae]|uniref:adenylate/guanylate cyclase domain-containing protein n=1 Tax=Bradyrhizobium sp. Oc8 TaxID=2876780 RepID=UPI001F30A562|nr:adenylate/guanylate cyclase domain-containing protein [Bradyrhizobium sp. Oc8]